MLLLRHTTVDVRLRDEMGLERWRAWCSRSLLAFCHGQQVLGVLVRAPS
jgi:hypothetical protein